MSTNLRMYTRMVFGFEHVIRQVGDRWHTATPCGEWDVRQVTGHTIAVVSNVAARAGVGGLLDRFGDVAATAGDDPLGSFRAARAATWWRPIGRRRCQTSFPPGSAG